MMHDFDLIVIGSGSGGGAAAHYAAGLGKKVAIVEKDVIGGECPNFACVPTKALLHAAETYDTILSAKQYGMVVPSVTFDYKGVKKWKDLVVSRTGAARGPDVFEDDDIRVIKGEARFVNAHEIRVANRRYHAKHFLIATGTSPFIPPVPGLADSGYITFKDAVDFSSLPESIFIMGGGPIGCEFTQVFASFGIKVYLADATPRLIAKEDEEVGTLVQALFEQKGVTVLTNSLVTHVAKKGSKKVVTYKTGETEHTVTVDEILVATGKKPNIDLDLERAGVAYDKHGIHVDPFLQTSVKNIYAAGDVVGPFLYTHTAYYQSYYAASNMFSRRKVKPDYRVVPRCIFTDPEVASVGITEQEAKEKKVAYRKGIAPIASVGRANTENAMNGFVKVITKPNGDIIGASIVSPRAGEMIHELALAIKLDASVDDITSMIHAYPTFSEAIKVACSSVE